MENQEDIFGDASQLNNDRIVHAFHHCLTKTREHLVRAIKNASGDGVYEDLCYDFHVGTMLLMSFFDGLALYVEKKLAPSPTEGTVLWHARSTFHDPKFSQLMAIKMRTNAYIIPGGITMATLCNYSKHYLPCLRLTTTYGEGPGDIHFLNTSASASATGPIISGLLKPLFNDAICAYQEFCRLMKNDCRHINHM
jgi:hypothetical protein